MEKNIEKILELGERIAKTFVGGPLLDARLSLHSLQKRYPQNIYYPGIEALINNFKNDLEKCKKAREKVKEEYGLEFQDFEDEYKELSLKGNNYLKLIEVKVN